MDAAIQRETSLNPPIYLFAHAMNSATLDGSNVEVFNLYGRCHRAVKGGAIQTPPLLLE